jgi:hypothetical protein
MPKPRRVSNILALAVLSTVYFRAMHPYEMAATMRAHGKDHDMKHQVGVALQPSCRTSKSTASSRSWTASAGAAARSARSTGSRDAGRAELADWTRELIEVPEREFPRFEAGLSVMAVLSPDEIEVLLRRRLDAMESQLAAHREMLAASAAVPRIFLLEAEYDLAVRDAEAAWVRGCSPSSPTARSRPFAWRDFHAPASCRPSWSTSRRGAASRIAT